MPVKAILNVTLIPDAKVSSVAAKIKPLDHVENVLTISKVMPVYMAPGSAASSIQPLDSIDLIVHISARTFNQVMRTVIDIRNTSHEIKSTITSFGFVDKKSNNKKSASRGKK